VVSGLSSLPQNEKANAHASKIDINIRRMVLERQPPTTLPIGRGFEDNNACDLCKSPVARTANTRCARARQKFAQSGCIREEATVPCR